MTTPSFRIFEKIAVEIGSSENVKEYAKTGIDIISSDYITQSAKALDLSLNVIS